MSTKTSTDKGALIAAQLELLIRATGHLEGEITRLAGENHEMIAGVSEILARDGQAQGVAGNELLTLLQVEDQVAQGLRQAARALRLMGDLMARLAEGAHPPSTAEMAAALLEIHHLADVRARLAARLNGDDQANETARAQAPGSIDLF